MSQYGVIYRLRWKTAQNDQTGTVNIYDTEVLIDDSDTPVVNSLIPSGNPLLISTINNNKAKYGIFSKQAKIEFISTANYNAYTFADSKDNRWLVVADNGTDTIFKGFLVLTDITRPFLPNPNVITLTASDNLGLLKEKPLTTDADETPTGKNRLADYLTWALAKTGLSLQIKTTSLVKHGSGSLTNQALFSVAGQYIITSGLSTNFFYVGQSITVTNSVSNNGTYTVTDVDNSGAVTTVYINATITTGENTLGVTFTDNQTGHVYDVVYIDAKTFEEEIGECEDCYTVLEKILDKDAFLVQHNNAWWIMRPDDFDGEELWVSTFDTDGSFLDDYTQTDLNKSIGRLEDQRWSGAIQSIEYERPYKFAKHTYRYENPREIPCNIDFSRGDYIADIDGDSKKYEVECWTLRRGYPTSYQATTISPYIQKNFNGVDYEEERYVVVPNAASVTYVEYLESEAIPITVKDKITVGFNWRLQSGTGLSSYRYIKYLGLVLFGDDGSYWMLGGDYSADDPSYEPGVSSPKWYNTSNFTVNIAASEIGYDFASIDETEWQSFSWEAPPAPVSGNLYLWLHNFKQETPTNYDRVVEFSSISVEYYPYINGSYRVYTGQSSKYSRSASGYSAKIDEEVSISDSPKPILKGSMFFLNGSTYHLSNSFFNDHPNNTGLTSGQPMPYEKLRVLANWNQYRISTGNKGVRYFTGDIYGLSDYLDMVNPVLLTDADTDASNRVFMVLSLEQDWRSCITNIKLVQTAHDDGKVTDDDFEFKYITE